jgi:hypothetical protein
MYTTEGPCMQPPRLRMSPLSCMLHGVLDVDMTAALTAVGGTTGV